MSSVCVKECSLDIYDLLASPAQNKARLLSNYCNLYSFKGETRTQVPASHFDRPLRRILAKMEDSLREVGHCY